MCNELIKKKLKWLILKEEEKMYKLIMESDISKCAWQSVRIIRETKKKRQRNRTEMWTNNHKNHITNDEIKTELKKKKKKVFIVLQIEQNDAKKVVLSACT